jgi:hypothetical protein
MGGLIVFNFDLSAKQQFGKCYTIFIIFLYFVVVFTDNCRRRFFIRKETIMMEKQDWVGERSMYVIFVFC